MPSTISPTIVYNAGTNKLITVAAGTPPGRCFWGVDHIYRKNYVDKGLVDAKVGFANGHVDNPSYKRLLTTWDYSNTVAEVLQISYDPAKLPLREIISFFYRIHDPTTLNSQGADKGTQYRSAIFYHDASDLAIIEEVTEEYSKKWKAPLVTKIEPIKNFYDAEDYHQEYLFKNPDGYHCETHYIRDFD
ncbi:K07304 peptide-methionine (S)-S-oxide reductase [Cyberlindnera jadinii]|uniref:peptide-methionine (S)-S-oxide reductase n=1 Tax=Cyberlindnera jadinii (strain ATCC 18201 / CBS 1600 / BCRC 20928 / JCM 3617 / NBRC 0987 / NRRL Y-1542) TaxID=983966 RepID=A0A0H5C8B5_CYBJN|nr:K07304 peptide-methionine (S)-S-oxide reductase [Cyberlindnera jadinii]